MLWLTHFSLTLYRQANIQPSSEQLVVTLKNWLHVTVSRQPTLVICRLFPTLLLDGLYYFVSFIFSGENNNICWSESIFAIFPVEYVSFCLRTCVGLSWEHIFQEINYFLFSNKSSIASWFYLLTYVDLNRFWFLFFVFYNNNNSYP